MIYWNSLKLYFIVYFESLTIQIIKLRAYHKVIILISLFLELVFSKRVQSQSSNVPSISLGIVIIFNFNNFLLWQFLYFWFFDSLILDVFHSLSESKLVCSDSLRRNLISSNDISFPSLISLLNLMYSFVNPQIKIFIR